jgi:CRISPR system Cascade subunit CasD
MTEPILLLRLEGPLQSWGVRSRWSLRDTGPEPSKSAIIGLLGCAAGILRPDWRSGAKFDRTLEQWDNALCFGVRIDRPGRIETDYHTVQGQHWRANDKLERRKTNEIHTELTWRDYLHDAAFLVALGLKPEYRDTNQDLLESLEEHLQFPKWPLYLGRKSCVPSRPILDRLTHEYQNLKSALQEELPAPRLRANLPPKLDAWIECPDGRYERQDSIRLNQLRFYGFRRCEPIPIDTDRFRRIA